MRLRSITRYAAEIAALATAMTLVSFGARLLQPGHNVTLVYPATGLGAAVLWGFGYRWWPAFFISQLITSYMASHSPWVALFVASTELLVVSLFTLVMARLRVSRDLQRLSD